MPLPVLARYAAVAHYRCQVAAAAAATRGVRAATQPLVRFDCSMSVDSGAFFGRPATVSVSCSPGFEARRPPRRDGPAWIRSRRSPWLRTPPGLPGRRGDHALPGFDADAPAAVDVSERSDVSLDRVPRWRGYGFRRLIQLAGSRMHVLAPHRVDTDGPRAAGLRVPLGRLRLVDTWSKGLTAMPGKQIRAGPTPATRRRCGCTTAQN